MATATIILKDSRTDDGVPTIEMEGRLDPPSAIDDAPTGAVIIGSFLAAHMQQIQDQAIAWFNEQFKAPPAKDDGPKIIVPGGSDIEGAPV